MRHSRSILFGAAAIVLVGTLALAVRSALDSEQSPAAPSPIGPGPRADAVRPALPADASHRRAELDEERASTSRAVAHLRVTSTSGNPVSGAVIRLVANVDPAARTMRGTRIGVTEADGRLDIFLGETDSFPLRIAIEASGYCPDNAKIAAPGAYEVELTLGHRLDVEVRRSDDTPLEGVPITVSARGFSFGEAVAIAQSWGEDSVTASLSTGVYCERTGPDGCATFTGLPGGPLRVYVAETGLHWVRKDPPNVVLPGHQNVTFWVDEMYAIALRVTNDECLGVHKFRFDKRFVKAVAGEAMKVATLRGVAQLGGNALFFPLVKRESVPEAEFLEWEASGTARMKRHGIVPFSAKPLRFSDLDQAPTWDLRDVPIDNSRTLGTVRLQFEDSHNAALDLMDRKLLWLHGVSEGCRDDGAMLSPGEEVQLTAGSYQCKRPPTLHEPLFDAFEFPRQVTVHADLLTTIPVRVNSVLVPVRVSLDRKGRPGPHWGSFEFYYADTDLRVSGMTLRDYGAEIHWLFPGRVKVTLWPEEGVAATTHADLPSEWISAPLELRLTCDE